MSMLTGVHCHVTIDSGQPGKRALINPNGTIIRCLVAGLGGGETCSLAVVESKGGCDRTVKVRVFPIRVAQYRKPLIN